MAKIEAKRVHRMINEEGDMEICIVAPSTLANHKAYEEIKDIEKLDVTIEKHREKRSLSANAYMWVLLDKIAKQLHNGETKETLYRTYIKAMGIFTPLPIKEEAVEGFRKIWEAHGIGWVLEVVDESKLKGYKLVHAYHGSSTYNTAQMSDLIEAVVQDAKNMGIETKTPLEIADMLSLWEQEEKRNG